MVDLMLVDYSAQLAANESETAPMIVYASTLCNNKGVAGAVIERKKNVTKIVWETE